MPGSAMVQNANSNLGSGSAARILREFPNEVDRLANPGTLVTAARRVLKLSDRDARYLAAIPSALREAMRAAIVDALANKKTVQFQYSPAYDFEVRFWDFGEALSVHVSGPYEPASPRAKSAYADKRSTARTRKPSRKPARKAKRKPARRRGS